MIKKLSLSFIVLLVSAILLELLLSITFYVKDRNLQAMDVKDAPYLYYSFNEREGTNEHGLKTAASKDKGAGKYRIILVGGSVARSKGDPKESIASKLENTLNRLLQTDVIEVVNAGVSGYVIQQEFLLTQMVLQDYEPDMIIGLDGFNDLYSFYLNYIDGSFYQTDFAVIPPHNWRDFKVISGHQDSRKFSARISSIFRNCNRLVIFFSRKLNRRGKLPPYAISETADIYWQTVGDMHDFCRSKRIRYFNFLQPARDYLSLDTASIFGDIRLNLLYHQMEEMVEELPYAFSLTGIFDEQHEVYLDYCHVTHRGNQILAGGMSDYLIPILLQDENLFFKLPTDTDSSQAE